LPVSETFYNVNGHRIHAGTTLLDAMSKSESSRCVKRGGPVSVTITDGIKDHKLVLVARNLVDRLRQHKSKLGIKTYIIFDFNHRKVVLETAQPSVLNLPVALS
jgi:hypothetical protein